MIGLTILLVAALWASLGYWLGRMLTAGAKPSRLRSPWLAVPLLALWTLLPLADEIAGAMVFDRLCEQMPPVEFHGPVSVGAGRFFDADGKRILWTAEEVEQGKSPFDSKDREVIWREHQKMNAAFDHEFKTVKTTAPVRTWPIPIFQHSVAYVQASSNKTVQLDKVLLSPGGWIKRAIGWGMHAPYTCSRQSGLRARIEWIKY
jgi:hypothetical protein